MSSKKRVKRSVSRARKSKSKRENKSLKRTRTSKKIPRKIIRRVSKKRSPQKTRSHSRKVSPKRTREGIRKRPAVVRRRPAPQYLKTPANWFLKKPNGEPASSADQARSIVYYQEGLKRARDLYAGFGTAEGYDLKRIPFWPEDRELAARKAVAETNRLYSTGYGSFIKVRPRSVAEDVALRQRTGQTTHFPGHPQYRYLVLANTPKTSRVRYLKEAVPLGFGVTQERLRAEVVTGVKGGRMMTREYIFSEILGFQPGIESASPFGLAQAERLGTADPWEQMKIAMREFERRLPKNVMRGKFKGEEAHYQMLTDRGPVGSVMPAHMLLANMERWGEEYGTHAGFAANLIGVLYRGSEFRAFTAQNRQEDARSRYAREKRERYKKSAAERLRARSMVDQFGYRLEVNKQGHLVRAESELFKSKRAKKHK